MDQLLQAFGLALGEIIALVLYGIYIMTYGLSLYFLLKKRRTHKAPINKIVALSGIGILLLVTAQQGINSWNLLHPFFGDQLDTSAVGLYAKSSNTTQCIIHQALFLGQRVMLNSLMIYRLWIISERSILTTGFPLCILVVGTSKCDHESFIRGTNLNAY